MKPLLHSLCLFFLLFLSSLLSAQNITVSPSTICEGNQVTFTVNKSIIPFGKTVAYYKFYYGNGTQATRLGTDPNGNIYTFSGTQCKPGNWVGMAEVVPTDSIPISAGSVNFTVYYKPIADFDLNNSKDTQCIKGNSFCFINKSIQNTVSPSNPIANCLWVFGDGSNSNSCAPAICHSYGIITNFDVVLRITDSIGCYTDIMNPPASKAKYGVTVVGSNTQPDFSWTQKSGHCFGSGYLFKNSAVSPKIGKLKSYTWDFGDSLSYSATKPFNTLQISSYDTIYHKYMQNGAFKPALIVQDTFGCIDTVKKTSQNVGLGIQLPWNTFFDIKMNKSTSFISTQDMDSFCAGPNLAHVNFFHSPVFTAQPGAGDFVWNFGDPSDPIKNMDSNTWQPTHIFSGVGKYKIKFTIKNICPDTSIFDSIEVLGPRAKIENTLTNSQISDFHKYQCTGTDTVDFVNNSSYYKSNHVNRLWDFDDDYAPLCVSYSVPKSSSLTTFANAQQQYYNSNHFYVLGGTTYAGRMNCRYSNDSLPRHVYNNWDSVYSWYVNGKTFPAGTGTPNINANTPITITSAKPVPDPFWQSQGRLLNLTSGTLRNKFDSITYTIPGFGTFKRYGNQLLPNSSLTFHEYVFRYCVNRPYTVKLTLTDSVNHASGELASCASFDTVNLSHSKPDAHGLSVTGRQCSGLSPGPGKIIFNLRANGIGAGTKPSCGQTYIYMNFDSLADRMDGTPLYLDGFTSWGIGSPGNPIQPGPGVNYTPGGLQRNTFYNQQNWNPNGAWKGPDGDKIVYHYGSNAGTPPPADKEQGFVTIGIFLGSGQKDTALSVWASNYKLNQTNSGLPLRDNQNRTINPSTGQLYTYQTLPVVYNVRNKATPPPDPIPTGWADDSVAFNYKWKGIISSTPQIRYTTPTIIWDTLLSLQYVDDKYPKCVSDTVWYHNFLHIQDQDPTFTKSPLEFAQLREIEDTMWVIYRDSIQDSLKTTVWTWGDNTATIDSFYYAGYDVTDGYYTHGARRVRYNIDYSFGYPGKILDSLAWPCGIYGQRQFQQPIGSYTRIFDVIGTKAPDTLILRNKFPSTTHFDQWYPYTNYHDTIRLRMRDTVLYTQFRTIDTALMMLPVPHQYKKSSWEIYGRTQGATINGITSFIENTQRCQYLLGNYVTIGVIDTLHIYDLNGKEDAIFCKNTNVHFADSVRYFRYDNSITNVSLLNFGRSRSHVYSTPPFVFYQFDTIDFWARDAADPSDTLINTSSLLSNSQIEFRYFPGKWTHWDFNMATGNVTYLPLLEGHWDLVLRGGSVPVAVPPFPTSIADTMYYTPYVGWTIFYPATGALGAPGIYSWTGSGWRPSFAPVTIDSLNSLSDISKTPVPVNGRTLIYNKGKGNTKRTGMYYWGGTQWVFICNSPHITFPYFTHRLYWDFGDGTPVYEGVKPIHKYTGNGKYKVTMVSRDSIGHLDTCISFVNISGVIAKPTIANTPFGCSDTAYFHDSSYTTNGGKIASRYWRFYSNAKDSFTVESTLQDPVWYYTRNGKLNATLTSISEQGCSATGTLSFFRNGPRPGFRLFSNPNGCVPYRIGIKNLADSADMQHAADTPTLSTIIYWGDGSNTDLTGRRDTAWHTYTGSGSYIIMAAGRDALPMNMVNCPVVYFPDTASGQKTVLINVSQSNPGKINGRTNPYINDTATYFVPNEAGATYLWTMQGGTVQTGAGTNSIRIKWPATSGIYNVIIQKTNTIGCTYMDTLSVHVLMTAINDLSSVSEIKMYPNPANKEVTISMKSQKNQDLNIKIYDILGKVCMSDVIKSANGLVNKNYSLNEMSRGMYFVEISNSEEKTVFKLLIE